MASLAGVQESGDSWEYDTNHQRLGTCLIINNDEFHRHTGMNARPGSSVDARKLTVTFAALGFNVVVKTNQTGLQMRQLIAEVCQDDHSDADCFACIVLSHGDAGIIYATDEYLTVKELVTPFSENRCKSLAGKPKLFFLQACRGDDLDEGVEVTDAETEDDGDTTYRSPNVPDVLIHYSTVYGYYSWRNPSKGSWYVQALCDVLNRELLATKSEEDTQIPAVRDIVSVLTRVNFQVSRDFQSKHSSRKFDEKKQMPCLLSMLRKQFYLQRKEFSAVDSKCSGK